MVENNNQRPMTGPVPCEDCQHKGLGHCLTCDRCGAKNIAWISAGLCWTCLNEVFEVTAAKEAAAAAAEADKQKGKNSG